MGIYLRNKVYWMCYTVDNKFQRESTGISDKAKALSFYYKRKTEIAEGKFLDKKKEHKIGFSEFADYYLENHSKVENKSWKKSDWVFIRALKKFFGKYFLSEINKELIARYKAERKKEGVSNAGINRNLACLKSIFNRAIDWGKFSGENPMRRVSMLKEPAGRTRYLERADIKLLIDCCEDAFLPYLVVAFNTGLRLSEQLSLKWEDIDFKNEIISVYLTKSGKKRVLPMNEDLKDILRNIPKQPESPYIFRDKNEKSNVSVRGAFKRAKNKAKIKNFHWHDIRHTTASHLAMSGVDLYTIKDLLGHSTLKMTERYAHLSKTHKENAIANLNGLTSIEKSQHSPSHNDNIFSKSKVYHKFITS